jgi:hypothetical protein
MKKLLLITGTFLFFSTSHYGQIDSSRATQIDVNLQQHFNQRSKNQLKAGLILVGSGIALDAVAWAIFPKDYVAYFWGTNSPKTTRQANISTVIFLIGSSALITSIPIFISSAVNRHKARILVNRERVELSPQIKTSQWQWKTGIAFSF